MPDTNLQDAGKRADAIQLDYVTCILNAFRNALMNPHQYSEMTHATTREARIRYQQGYNEPDGTRWEIITTIRVETQAEPR